MNSQFWLYHAKALNQGSKKKTDYPLVRVCNQLLFQQVVCLWSIMLLMLELQRFHTVFTVTCLYPDCTTPWLGAVHVTCWEDIGSAF